MAAKLDRRLFLKGAAATAAGIALASCAKPTPQVVEKQVTVEKVVMETIVVEKPVTVEKVVKETVIVQKEVPVEKVVTATPLPAKYSEAPMLAELVKAGKLPPVVDRLPEDPRVIDVLEEIGQYGGTWRRAYKGISDRWGTEKIVVENMLAWDMPQGGSISIISNVVSKFDVSADATEYTWYLRKGIKWSDGTPFLASTDVKFWYEDLFQNELAQTWGVKNTRLEVGGVPMVITIVDDFTYKMKFGAPNPLLPIFIAVGNFDYTGNRSPGFAAPAHYMKKLHPKYASQADLEALVKKFGLQTVDQLLVTQNQPNFFFLNPDVPTIHPWITTVSPQVNQDLAVTERNPYYWQVDPEGNQLPYVDRITWRYFDNDETFNFWLIGGEIDCQNRHINAANFTLFKENEAKGGYRTIIWSEAATLSYFINTAYQKDPVLSEIFNDLRFRQAFSVAINRDEINQVVFQGMYEPRQACPVSGSPDWNADWEKYYAQYDPVLANTLLDEMGLDKRNADGLRLRKDGQPLEILLEYATVSFAGTTDMHQFTAEYMKAIGINLILKSEERSLYESRAAENEYQITCWVRDRSAVPISDPGNFLVGGATGGTWNTWFSSGGTSGEKPPDGAPIWHAQELWNQVLVEGDATKRQAIWQELLDYNKVNLWVIGVCGEAPAPLITTNNFRNVPSGLVQDDPLRGERLGRTQQYFFKA